MGVEPTAAGLEPPATDFEDQGAHRDTSLPTSIVQDGDIVRQEHAVHRRPNCAYHFVRNIVYSIAPPIAPTACSYRIINRLLNS